MSISFVAGQPVASQDYLPIGQHGGIFSYNQGADVRVTYDATGYDANPGAFT
ncbi:MAG: hypothetical protein AB7W59_29300 [Acidimicrobiia bacterium]